MHPKLDRPVSVEEYDAVTRTWFWVFVQRVFAELTNEPFSDNFHIQVLCGEVDRIRTEPCTRLAIALPPRSLKSIIVSVALPAWLLGHDPGTKVVCVSYGQEFADELSANCRQVMSAPWYRRLFPATVLDRKAMGHLATTANGKRYATSVGGTLTGMGADVIIVDDPMKPDEAASDAERRKITDWASHTLFTRINKKSEDRIVVVQQRLHEEDMIGSVMEKGGFELLSFPAIAPEDEEHLIRTPFGTFTHSRKEGEALHPEREPIEVLEKQRRQMGSAMFAAQYLQSPTPPGGGIVKVDWFQRYDRNQPPTFVRIIQSWDCAAKVSQANDYSVCTTWGVTRDKHAYLLHVFRERLEYPELKRKVRELSAQRNADIVLIEDTTTGTPLIAELRQEGFAHIEPIRPRLDKPSRMRAQTPRMEDGHAWVPQDAPWLADYLHELAMFPNARFDDQVDSTSQALEYIWRVDRGANLAKALDFQNLRASGDPLNDEICTFRCNDPSSPPYFTTYRGRRLQRGPDGYFRCYRDEWEWVSSRSDLTLIRTARAGDL